MHDACCTHWQLTDVTISPASPPSAAQGEVAQLMQVQRKVASWISSTDGANPTSLFKH